MSNNIHEKPVLSFIEEQANSSKYCIFTIVSCSISFVLFEGTKKTVALTVNGEQQEISTHANTVENF